LKQEHERKVKNLELIEKIYNIIESKEENEFINRVCFRKVAAHVLNPVLDSREYFNSIADQLARDALRIQIPENEDNLFEENTNLSASRNGDNLSDANNDSGGDNGDNGGIIARSILSYSDNQSVEETESDFNEKIDDENKDTDKDRNQGNFRVTDIKFTD
jgi:hypothetical protein